MFTRVNRALGRNLKDIDKTRVFLRRAGAGFLSLQSGSTLEQKLARAGISMEQIRYIV